MTDEDYALQPGTDKAWLERLRKKQGKKTVFEEHLDH